MNEDTLAKQVDALDLEAALGSAGGSKGSSRTSAARDCDTTSHAASVLGAANDYCTS